MTGTTKEDQGSFKGMRARELLLFDSALHRHDRGWPHPPPEDKAETRSKQRWQRVGIVHFAHEDHDEKADRGTPAPAGRL